MGEFRLTGHGAAAALCKIVTQDLATLAEGKCRYGFLLNAQAGVLDDLIVYCLGYDDYMLVVNASRAKDDYSHIASHLPAGLKFTDISLSTAKIDLQGPKSFAALAKILPGNWNTLKYFNFVFSEFKGLPLMVSRTGYTGELGVEFFIASEAAVELWELLLSAGEVLPAGLGARDTLRLEMGYPLYGQELDSEHNPIEAGYASLIAGRGGFIGADKLNNIRESLIALEIPGRRSARTHDKVCLPDGREVGEVRSGSFAPSLGHCVATAYVRYEVSGQEDFIVRAAKTELAAKRASLPFYRRGTARTAL